MKTITKTRKPTTKAGHVRLLSGGNPQIAKADGDAPEDQGQLTWKRSPVFSIYTISCSR